MQARPSRSFASAGLTTVRLPFYAAANEELES